MQETLEDEWKAETREKGRKERGGKEEAEEKKGENNFVNHN